MVRSPCITLQGAELDGKKITVEFAERQSGPVHKTSKVIRKTGRGIKYGGTANLCRVSEEGGKKIITLGS